MTNLPLLSSAIESLWTGFAAVWQVYAVIGCMVLSAFLVRLALSSIEDRRLRRAGIADIDKMTGLDFEKYLTIAYRKQGYSVERTRYVGDYGADLVLQKDGQRIAVQAKRWQGRVGPKAVQEIVASKAKYSCEGAIVVTNSTFTKAAHELARVNKVRTVERAGLIDLLVSGAPSAADQVAAEVKEDRGAGPACATCGQAVSQKVADYCAEHRDWFGGAVYCYGHQAGARTQHRAPNTTT